MGWSRGPNTNGPASSIIRDCLKKNGFWLKIKAGAKFKPEENRRYFEELNFVPGAESGPKDIFEIDSTILCGAVQKEFIVHPPVNPHPTARLWPLPRGQAPQPAGATPGFQVCFRKGSAYGGNAFESKEPSSAPCFQISGHRRQRNTGQHGNHICQPHFHQRPRQPGVTHHVSHAEQWDESKDRQHARCEYTGKGSQY
jgi:hypothetical protein